MFKTSGGNFAHIDPLADAIKTLVARHPFPPYNHDEPFSRDAHARAKTRYEAFAGPTQDPENWAFVFNMDNDPDCEFVGVVRFDTSAEKVVTLDIILEEEMDYEAFSMIEPVKTYVARKKEIRPNDPCRCGSGKKSKKCCARSV